MIWESIWAMTIVDVAIIAMVICVLGFLVRAHGLRFRQPVRYGLAAIVGGLLIVAVFYFVDLLAMHLFPVFMSMTEAMAFMQDLHLQHRWLVALFGFGAVSVGVASTIHGVAALLRTVEESEQRLRAIFDNVPAALFLKDADGRYKLVNQRYADWFGVDLESVAGKTAHELFPKERADAYADGDRTVAQYRSVAVDEVEIPLPSGETKTFIMTKFPVMDGERVTDIGAVMTDITDRKEAESALRESERQYRGLAELSPDAVIVQVGGLIVFANESAKRKFGAKSVDDLVGLDALSIVHPDAHEFVLHRRQLALEEGRPVPYAETRHQRLDGASFPSEMIAGPVVWRDQLGTMNIIHDITERKRAERARRESEAKFRDFAELSSDWFWEMDAELCFS